MIVKEDYSHLCGDDWETRLLPPESSSEEGETEDEKDIGQDGAEHLEQYAEVELISASQT